MRKYILRSTCLMMVSCASAAYADHGIHNTGLAPAQTNSMLQLQQSVGSFEVNGEHGRWSQSYLQGEYIVTERLSTMLGVPWSRVQRGGGASVAGLGDLSLALRGQLYSNEDRRVLFALNSELPTGDDHRGLGGGHFELAPMVILAERLSERFTLTASLTHGLVFGGHHAHEDSDGHDHGQGGDHEDHVGALIRPHGEHETISTLGLLFNTERGFVESSVSFGFGFEQESSVVAAPVELRLQGGLNLDDGVALTVGSTQTIIGPQRAPWVIDVGLLMLFSATPTLKGSQSAEEHHEHERQHSHDDTHDHHPHEH